MSQSTLFQNTPESQDSVGTENAPAIASPSGPAKSGSLFSDLSPPNASSTSYTAPGDNEFSYRPVPILAPLSLAFGVLSGLGFLGLLCIPIGLVGTIVSVMCILFLRRRRGEYGGMGLAVTGLLLSITCFTASAAIWVQGYRTEVPEGFQRISFLDDISKKGFVVSKKSEEIFHPEVKKLDGQKIFLKGYMYPTKQMNGLTSFLLVKDMGQCCFGGNPKPNDMVLINMDSNKATNYMQGLVSVAGVFHCQPAVGPANLNPVYTMDGKTVENSRTVF